MVAAIVNFVTARIELLRLNLLSGLDPVSDKYQSLSQETTAQFTKQIDNVGKINRETATTILQLVTECPNNAKIFSDAQIGTLRDSVNKKIAQHMGLASRSTSCTRRLMPPRHG